jgi:hypothetical protein
MLIWFQWGGFEIPAKLAARPCRKFSSALAARRPAVSNPSVNRLRHGWRGTWALWPLSPGHRLNLAL